MYATFRILPGVDVNRTPTLNEAAISSCNLIRFVSDREGGLPQKRGGWSRFYPSALSAIPRALWAWEDTNANTYLAAGCETSATVGEGAPLVVINDGTARTITPKAVQSDEAPDATTTTTSNIVTITDVASSVTSYDSVYIPAHISVGGIIIFGFYQCTGASTDTYTISLFDAIGNPVYPTSADTNAGVVAEFTTTSGTSVVEVVLPDHGYSIGSTYPILISTTIGGITLFGNYLVQSVVDADTFTINGGSTASASDTAFINGGDARYYYYQAEGPPPSGSGYGVGGYGTGGYGAGTGASVPVTGSAINASDWSLDNWGEILAAMPAGTTFGPSDGTTPIGGPLYVWSPTANDPTAVVVPTAPIASDGFFVAMPFRQIVAWGTTFTGIQDPLLIRWSNINSYSDWYATTTSQAGSYRIAKGSRIVAGIQGPQQGLIWTDLAVWAMQYVGLDNGVYEFNEIATGCGLIAKKAAAALAGTIYWMGQSQFFTLSGAGVLPLPCPIWDVIFQNLDSANKHKIRVAPNSRFNEIEWYYPSENGGGEVDSYVKYNVLLGTWDFGTIGRTAWINESVLGPPIGASPQRLIFQHETSPDADGQAMLPSLTTGYFTIQDGDFMSFIDQWRPDMKWGPYGSSPNATVQFTFNVVDYAGQTPRTYGPYSVTQAVEFISPRFRGRLVSMTVSSDDVGSFWRLGSNRYRWAPAGKF